MFLSFLNNLNNVLKILYCFFLIYAYFTIFLKFLGRKQPLFYERLTKTENTSTINYIPKASQEAENMLNYNVDEEEKDESRN